MPNAGDLEKGRNAATSVRQSSASAHTLIAKLHKPVLNNNLDVEHAIFKLYDTLNLLIQAYNTQDVGNDLYKAQNLGNWSIAEALERKAKGEVCTCLVPIIKHKRNEAGAVIHVCEACGKENISHLEMEPE